MIYTLQIHARTDRALLVSDDGDEDSAVWIPLSQVEVLDAAGDPDTMEIEIPDWLATDKGLA